LVFLLLLATSAAAQWKPIGPHGGDVRALAADPGDFSRIFLGTSNGQIYASTDGGRTWLWWAEIAPRSDLVVDDILVDAAERSVMYAGAWSTEPNGGGGVFKSSDGGRTWRALPDMAGQSVRALEQSRSQPSLLVAGTLDGVYRTANAGRSWERISPPYHEEIRNIESLAIDPTDPQVIYAGTWHLPWKTADGGRTWMLVKTGIIDDSDIFSILVDWSNHKTLYASACSGIYRTDSAGAQWRKIQGIPHSARRTRVLRQDPRNPAVLYAGTTEGLWKTDSGGRAWARLTSARLVINDILIDPRDTGHFFLGTDRAGVLESGDGGQTFLASNQGFAHRQVSRAAYDPATGRIYAAVLNDREYGGVFSSEAGRAWRQLHAGLEERDVFALVYARAAESGRLLAGLRDGVVAFDSQTNTWTRVGRLMRVWQPPPTRRGPQLPPPRLNLPFESEVTDFFQAAPGQPLYAATKTGIYKSADAGDNWEAVSPKFSANTIAAEGNFLVAGTHTGLELSFNSGGHWFHIYLPSSDDVHVNAVAVAGKTIFAATESGLFRSVDAGVNWEKKGRGVPYGPAFGVRIHPGNAREVYATAGTPANVYVSQDSGRTFRAVERNGLVGPRLRSLEILQGNGAPLRFQLLVASAHDGLFLLPLEAPAIAEAAASQNGK